MKQTSFLTIIIISLFLSCSEDAPTYFYEPVNFEILRLGSNINDLVLSQDGNTLIASDGGNNRIMFFDVSGDMFLTDVVVVGSKPNGLTLSADDDYVYVSLSGSSNIAVVEIASRDLSYLPLEEDGPMDVEVFGDLLITTFISDQSAYHRTKLYNIASQDELANKPKAGLITKSDAGNSIFVLDKSFDIVGLYRYDILNNTLEGNIQSSDIALHPAEFNDLHYVHNVGVAVAISGLDFEGNEIKNVFLFEPDGLNLLAHLDSKSAPHALASLDNGSSIFVSPSKEDGAGTFIIEFDTENFLQRNYYLTAGRLAKSALVIDSENQYIYCAVDDQADNSNDEPYSNNSFDIQRIRIEPYDTYNINDF
jgi:hypothetical protein